MLYTEDFKRQVVKKILSPGVIKKDICRKLKISTSSLRKWQIQYGADMQQEVQELDVAALLHEPPVDIEELIAKADQEKLATDNGHEALAQQVDQIRRIQKDVSSYTDDEKYAVVLFMRELPPVQQGVWLRQLGIQSPHILLWEKELIAMSKRTITTDQYIKKIEAENKLLTKQLAEAQRDNRELKILIELKKKYHTLFQGEDTK